MSIARSTSRLLGTLALGLSFTALSHSAAAASGQGVSPKTFEGSYVLTHASMGNCLPEMLVSTYQDNNGAYGLEGGTYSLTRINSGTTVNTAGGIRVTEKTYTTANQTLISSQSTYDPAGPSTTKEMISFKLVGNRLTVRSESIFTMPGTPNVDYPVSCEYKRVACSKTASGCL